MARTPIPRLPTAKDARLAEAELESALQQLALEKRRKELDLEKVGVDIDSAKQELAHSIADGDLIRGETKGILTAFRYLNIGVFGFVVAAFLYQIGRPDRPNPLITEKVVLALIAGSTAQLGALALGVGKRLWR